MNGAKERAEQSRRHTQEKQRGERGSRAEEEGEGGEANDLLKGEPGKGHHPFGFSKEKPILTPYYETTTAN